LSFVILGAANCVTELVIGQKLLLFVLFSLEITMTKTTRPFTPDWVSPPGDAIADLLEERDWTQAQLAERLGYTTKHISQLINGKAPINEETALTGYG
jgi:Helix-turn-helix